MGRSATREQTKVLHLTSAHPATDTRIFAKECRSAAEAGYQVVLAVAGASSGVRDGVRLVGVEKASGRVSRALLGVVRLARVIRRERPQIVHFHDPELLPLGIALRLLRRDVVYDVHEWNLGSIRSRTYLRPTVARLFGRGVWLLEQLFDRLGGRIVAATPFIASQFTDQRTVLVRNYPDLREIAADGGVAHRGHGTTFCYVGGLSPERCGPALVEAIRHVVQERDGVRCVMAGPVEDVVIDPSVIEHRGVVDRKGVSEILLSSDVGIVLLADLPNYGDSMPTKFFEYLAAGLPVIANETAAIVREIMEECRVGLVVDGRDPNAIAQAMRWMIDHPAEREEMGLRTRAAGETMTWEREARSLVELYDGVRTGADQRRGDQVD